MLTWASNVPKPTRPNKPKFNNLKVEDVAKKEAYEVNDIFELQEYINVILHYSSAFDIFFRGQTGDYMVDNDVDNRSTILPSIFRNIYFDKKPVEKFKGKVEKLIKAEERLIQVCYELNIHGESKIKSNQYARWAVIQHYGIADTPVLDITKSLRIASKFSVLNHDSASKPLDDLDFGYLYIFGLPQTKKSGKGSKAKYEGADDILNIDLKSLCPPTAHRPFFQDGYISYHHNIDKGILNLNQVVIDLDIAIKNEKKAEQSIISEVFQPYNFNGRLLAKFKVPKTLFGDGVHPIPKTQIYPEGDLFEEYVVSEVKRRMNL